MAYKLPSMLMPAAQAGGSTASIAAARPVPPIDALAPSAVETATFALG